jgi:ferredoxin
MISAIQRFPKPEFETGYVQPDTLLPFPRAEWLALLDVAVLILSLAIAAWLVLNKRSRMGVWLLSLFSLVYFGFYRQGCVCSVGSVQNVALGLFNPDYDIPLVVIIFFLAPLLFTLLFGRGFCAAVCPFGALQDLVAFRPRRINPALDAFLGLIPVLYLGLSVLLAATGSDFIICRYDPFVGIFRMNATFGMFLFAAILLVAGIMIARPYCRFFCPYGVLLNWVSRFSWKHMTITPAECIQCRLCEDSCPYEAIDEPRLKGYPAGKQVQTRRLMYLTLLLPLFILAGSFLGHLIHPALAGTHPRVNLLRMLESPAQPGQPEPPEITAFKSSGIPLEKLREEVSTIESGFQQGSCIYGGFTGLIFGLTLIGLVRIRFSGDYQPNRGKCFSCGKCMDYCPIGKQESKPTGL